MSDVRRYFLTVPVCATCGGPASGTFNDGSPRFDSTHVHPPMRPGMPVHAAYAAAVEAAERSAVDAIEDAGRYDYARRKGIRDRAYHLPLPPRDTDAMAGAAERFFCRRYGLPEPTTRGPDIADAIVGGATIDVKWTPRRDGRLLCRLDARRMDYYVLVTGERADTFDIRGWATGDELHARVIDLGHGPGHGLSQSDLHPDVDALMETLSR